MYWFPNRPLLQDRSFLRLKLDPVWIAEPKWNGDRLVLQWDGKGWKFMNRHKQEFKYHPSIELMQDLAKLQLGDYPCQLDGELMHFKSKSMKHFIWIYDIYIYQGEQVRVNFSDRRKLLADIFYGINADANNVALVSQYLVGNQEKLFNVLVKNSDIEGLVFKRGDGMLEFDAAKSPDVPWQIKVRKECNKYKF